MAKGGSKVYAAWLLTANHQGAVLASDSLVMLEQCQKEATEEKQK